MNDFYRKRAKINTRISLLIFLLPFIPHLHLLFSETEAFEGTFLNIDYNTKEFAAPYFYNLLTMAYVFIFLSIWFITIKEWWRYILLALILLIFYLFLNYVIYLFDKELLLISYLITSPLLVYFLEKLNTSFLKYRVGNLRKIELDVIKIILVHEENKKILEEKINGVIQSSKIKDNNLLEKIKKLESNLLLKGSSDFVNEFQAKNTLSNILIPILIILAPVIVISHVLIPPDIRTYDFGLFSITSNYSDLQLYYWIAAVKFFSILLLSIWFFSCNNFWKYPILFNIMVSMFQMVNALLDKNRFVDETEILYALPFVLPVIVILYFLGNIVNYKDRITVLNDEIKNQINEIIDQLSIEKLEENLILKELQTLKLNQSNLDEKDYLKQLNNIKNQLEKK